MAQMVDEEAPSSCEDVTRYSNCGGQEKHYNLHYHAADSLVSASQGSSVPDKTALQCWTHYIIYTEAHLLDHGD